MASNYIFSDRNLFYFLFSRWIAFYTALFNDQCPMCSVFMAIQHCHWNRTRCKFGIYIQTTSIKLIHWTQNCRLRSKLCSPLTGTIRKIVRTTFLFNFSWTGFWYIRINISTQWYGLCIMHTRQAYLLLLVVKMLADILQFPIKTFPFVVRLSIVRCSLVSGFEFT